MSIEFKQYSVSLNHFYSLMGSGDQQIINEVFTYLEKEFHFWDYAIVDKVIELSKIHLDNLIIRGFVTRCKPGWDISPFNTHEENVQSDLEHATLVDVYIALFRLNPLFHDYGGSNMLDYKPIFSGLEAINHKVNRNIAQFGYLLGNSRPLYGEYIHYDNHYTYLLHSEIPPIVNALSFYSTKTGCEYTKTLLETDFYYNADKNSPDEDSFLATTESLNDTIREIYEKGADFFAYVR